MTNYYSNSADYHNDLDAFEARMRAEEAERELNKKTPTCTGTDPLRCDDPRCPVHGKDITPGAFSADEIKADYQERGDLYAMGMGY